MNVTVEAWEAADAAKGPNESFSDLLLRTFRPTGLRGLVGLLSDEEGERWKAELAAARERSIRDSQQRMKRLGWP